MCMDTSRNSPEHWIILEIWRNFINYFGFQYLDALAQQRLCNNVRDEVDSFLKGLNGIIPDNLLSIFDENELEVKKTIFKCCDFQFKYFLHAAPTVRHGRVFDRWLSGPSHCQRKFSRVSSCPRLVLGGHQQFQSNGNGTFVTIHHRLFTITTGWISSENH